MGEIILIAIWLAAWAAAIYVACRIGLWLLRTVVGATGKAWRGEP